MISNWTIHKVWTQKISDKERIRIKETINMIPSDVKSILDLDMAMAELQMKWGHLRKFSLKT